MNKINNLFRKVLRFIDKKIITPITKFFVWLYEKITKGGKGFERLFSRKSSLIIISLILSVALFLYVDNKSTNILETSAEVLYNQKVNAIYNEEAYVIEGIPEKVDVTMVGRKSDLYLAKQLPIDAIDVDLTSLKTGTHKVSLKYKGTIDTISYKIDPSVATVVIYPKMSEVRTLSVDILNQDKLNSKLSISSVEIDRQEVIIKGAQYKLDQVATVKALVDINNIVNPEEGSMTLSDVQLIAYDKEGNIIDVETVPNKVTATVKIASPSKVVPLKIIPKGTLEFGKAISSIVSSVESVTIYGDEASLANVIAIEAEIDVKGLDSNKKYTVTIKKPSGIRYISETSATVNVTVESESSKEISNIQIEYENLASSYTLNAASDSDKYATVVVKGVKSVIDNITAENIKAYVDLNGYSTGTHEVNVIIEGTDVRATYTPKVKTINIIIKSKS